jgi:hypothetical protein
VGQLSSGIIDCNNTEAVDIWQACEFRVVFVKFKKQLLRSLCSSQKTLLFPARSIAFVSNVVNRILLQEHHHGAPAAAKIWHT